MEKNGARVRQAEARAIIDKMFEEFRNLSNSDDLHFDYLESLLETSGANNGGRA